MAIARKIAYNVMVSSIAKVFSTALSLVAIGFITRYLGKEGFGDYATVLAFLSFFAAIADLGLYHISTREISKPGADERKIIGSIFTLRVFSALVVFAIAPLIAWLFPYSEEVKRGIVIVAGSFIFSSSYQVLNGVFQKNLSMDKVAVGELIGKIIQVGFVVFSVKHNLGFDWIIAALLFNMIGSFMIVMLWSRKYLHFGFNLDFKYWKIFLKESVPVGVMSVIVFVYFKMDTILLSIMRTNTDVGIYNAAYKVLENITFFPAMIVGLMLPIMSHTINSDRRRFDQVADKTLKFFMVLTVPLIIGVLFLAEGIIAVIGGEGFKESVAVLRVLVFALAAIFYGVFFNNILIAGNLQKKLLQISGAAAVMNIVLNLIFIPRFSYMAAASVSFLTELCVASLSLFYVIKFVKYRPRLEKIRGILSAGIIMTVFLWLSPGMGFFMRLISSAVFYLAALWFFKAINKNEILSLISRESVEEYEELP